MQIFFTQILAFPKATLDQEETRHCIKVLRHKEGDLIFVTEGKGVLYKARIHSFTKTETLLDIRESFENHGEHESNIRLVVSPLRLKDRFEWMMEKAVELGVNEIIPLQCKRTDTYKAKFKPSRIQTILLAALKQSKRTQLPLLHELQHFEQWIKQPQSGAKFMGWCEAKEPIAAHAEALKESQQLTLLIGPEGDFTNEEVVWAQEAGFQPISLGENRLRTETAAIFALGIAKFVKGY